MTVRSKRLIGAGVVACLGAALPFGVKIFAQNPAPAGPKLEMSQTYFKNVKVLTGIPVDEFMGTMGLFSAALSYCCGDCHTGAGTDNPDWAADPPRKVIARRMAAMVKAINKDNFGGGNAVTCWTCHRGSPDPSVTPSLDTIYGEPLPFPSDTIVAAKPGSNAPTLDQIFDKYMQALGGAAWKAASPATRPEGPATCLARRARTRSRSMRKRRTSWPHSFTSAEAIWPVPSMAAMRGSCCRSPW